MIHTHTHSHVYATSDISAAGARAGPARAPRCDYKYDLVVRTVDHCHRRFEIERCERIAGPPKLSPYHLANHSFRFAVLCVRQTNVMQYTLVVCATVVLIAASGHCSEDSPADSITKQQLPREPHVSDGQKTKRGIFHHSRHAHLLPHSHHVPVHGLTYNVPLGTAAYPHYGFQKPWQQPFGHRSVPHHHHLVHHVGLAATTPTFIAAAALPTTAVIHHHHQPLPVGPVVSGTAHIVPPPPPPPAPIQPQFVLSPGDATVTSYNVNYPRYPYYGRPHVDVPVVAPAGVRPPPSVFVKPVFAGAAGSLIPTYTNRIPIGRPVFSAGPAVFPHPHQYVPTASSADGVYPIAASGVPHHHHTHFVPAATVPTFVAATPLAPAQPTLRVIPTIPTTASTTFDQWRPIYVAQPTYTEISPGAGDAQPHLHAGQPAISLLPPFGNAPGNTGAGAGVSSTLFDEQTLFQQQLELQQQQQQQQQYESAAAAAAEYTAEQHHQQQSQVYGPPSDNSLDAGQEYVQGK